MTTTGPDRVASAVWMRRNGDVAEFLKQFLSYLAPNLDAYEQTFYLYIFRHGRLIGPDEVPIGFKKCRRIASYSWSANNTWDLEGGKYHLEYNLSH